MLFLCAWAAPRTKNTYYQSKNDSLVPRKVKKMALKIVLGYKIPVDAFFILKQYIVNYDMNIY